MPGSTSVGVRGFGPDGSKLVLRLERLPAVRQSSEDAWVTRMRVRVVREPGVAGEPEQVLAEISVAEGTFIKAVRQLFSEEIALGRQKLERTLRRDARPAISQGSQRPQRPPQATGLDWKDLARIGAMAFEDVIPGPVKRIVDIYTTKPGGSGSGPGSGGRGA